MPNYAAGKIYKVTCTIPGLQGPNSCYVGGTTLTLHLRLRSHINASDKGTSKVHRFMREYGKDNFQIELLETTPCKNREELNAKEQVWIDRLQPALNEQNATRHPDATHIYNTKPETRARSNARYAAWPQETRDAINKKTREKRVTWTQEQRDTVRNKKKAKYEARTEDQRLAANKKWREWYAKSMAKKKLNK